MRAGRQQYCKATYCCSACHHVQAPSWLDLFQHRLWPVSVHAAQTYIHQDCLEDYRCAKLHQPELTMQAFLAALAVESARYGSEVQCACWFCLGTPVLG